MLKTHKLLLNDYLKDKTDLRLLLFANSINPTFKLDKKTKDGLISLINDYERDVSNKMRIKNIESFLGLVVNQAGRGKRITPSEIKVMTPEKKAEISELNLKMEEIRDKIHALRRRLHVGNPANDRINDEIDVLMAELRPYEEEAGYYNPAPPEKSQLDIILGLLGHWDDENSIAHELIYGNRPRVEIRTSTDIPAMIFNLGRLSGKTVRQFYCQNNCISGSLSASGKQDNQMIWVLTDPKSGLQPMNDRLSVKLDGREADPSILGSAGAGLNQNVGNMSMPAWK